MAGAPDWIQAVGSIVAIMAAAVAIFLQSRELGEQRKELAAQRTELELQRRQLDLQRQEMAKNVLIQERIAETANYQGYLDLQIRLLVLMFQYPELSPVFGLPDARGEREGWMRRTYITAWMRLLQSGYALGQVAEDSIQLELQESLLATQLGLDWWRAVEHVWRAEAAEGDRTDAHRRIAFVELVERICRDAEDRQRSRSGED